jgi:hypothetical protein
VVHIEDTVTVGSFLFLLEGLTKDRDTSGQVTRRVGVKHPYVKECALLLCPEAPGLDVCPRIRVSVGTDWEDNFTRERKQWRLHLNIT